jgi:uncharacterized protein
MNTRTHIRFRRCPWGAITPPLLLVALLLSCSSPPPDASPTVAVSIAGRTFHLEVADTPQARYQGLSDRRTLAADGGMLFVFPKAATQIFVMRRCHFPIDLIYLSPAARIVSMHRMAVEPADTAEYNLVRYESTWPAQYAIELAGGAIDTLGLREGQKIALPLNALKAR